MNFIAQTLNSMSYRGFALAGLFIGVVLIQACGRPVPHQDSCNFVQNQNMRRVSWQRPDLVNLYLDESIPHDYISGIEVAVRHWNELGERKFGGAFFALNRTAGVGSSKPERDGYSKIYLMHTWEADKYNEQARTTIYWSGDRIFEADIRINKKDFDFFTGETPDNSRVHLESLLIHELGHVLGLAHTDDHTSVMQVSLAPGKVRETIGRLDVESLQCEYNSHL